MCLNSAFLVDCDIQSFASETVNMIGIIIFVGAVTARDGCMPERLIYRQGLDEKCEHLNISAITDVSHSNLKTFFLISIVRGCM